MPGLVSVIIPCYNALPFLKETLTSVFYQSYPNIEVIVIDDGSTDGSYEYVESLNKSHLTLVKNKGKGACAARNYGLKLATGVYIQFLDADDLLSADKIEAQVRQLEQYPSRVAVCSTVHFYEDPKDGKIVDQNFMLNTNQPQDFLLKLYGGDGSHHNMVQTSAWLTPRALIEKAGFWDETLSKDQDGEYFCRVVMASDGVCYAPDVFNYYRKHVGGQNIANQKQLKHLESQLKAIEAKAKYLNPFVNTQAYKNAFALQYQLLAINAYPQFKSIYKIAINKSQALGGSGHLPVLGGAIIEYIKGLLGWRAAKMLSHWVHEIK